MSIRRWNSAPMFERSETDPMIVEVSEQASSPPPPENASYDKNHQSSGVMMIAEDTSKHTTLTTDVLESDVSNGGEEASSPRTTSRGLGWGRGIVMDFKRTVGTHWKGEMINFDQKTIAVSFFLFFACIAPAITFGAIYAKATKNWIGAVEMITATAWCGIVYGLIGGQPMMINGGTGPVLAFTEILYKMSQNMGVPFLTLNAWIGLWVCIYMCVAAFVDLNRILVYATRFTDEIFSFLIATIFIINAIGSPFAQVGVVYYFDPDHPSHEEHQDDPDYSYMASALLSLILCLGTVEIAFLLRKIKFSPFFPSQIARNVVTDFAVVIAILLMAILGQLLMNTVPTETLNVPDSFAPTYSCCTEACDSNWPDDCPELEQPYGQRPWLVDLFDLNGKDYVPFMAAGPAILAFILVFLDDGITWHLINHPAHKLTHGSAYNYDTLIVGLMIGVNSILGLPWLVAATVRSLNHVHAMAEKTADGKILSVKETRLTHLFIHILCLASIFALEVLKLIPMPVLYGVFLFMGLVSLGTNQFWGRILMFSMQPSKYPLEPYTMHMKPRRMHLYTAIQLGLFALLYTIKAIKAIAIAFPVVIACCIPIRSFLLPKIFTEEELIMIDSDEETVRKWLSTHAEVVEETPEPSKHDIEKGDDHHGEEEDHHDEHLDVVTPLPDITKSAEEKKRGRPRRKKALSCPSHMLFAEIPFDSSPEIGVALVEQEETIPEEGASHDDVARETHEEMPRRRRTKAVSCPPHMLFAEAERHIASNYFFG